MMAQPQKPFVKNAADERQVKEAEVKVKIGRELELEDLKKILSLPAGRRFIWRYLGICRLYKISFTGNSETFYNEGMRNIGLKLLDDVTEASPEAYLEMMKEHRKGDHDG